MWLTANPCPEAGLRAQVAWVLNSRGEAALTARRAASDPLAYTEDTIVRVRGLLAAVDCDSGGLNAGYGWPTQRCRIFVLVGPTYLTSGRRLGRNCGCPGRRFAAAGIACICRRETGRTGSHVRTGRSWREGCTGRSWRSSSQHFTPTVLLEGCAAQGPYGPMGHRIQSPESQEDRVGNRRGPDRTLAPPSRQITMDLVPTPSSPWRISDRSRGYIEAAMSRLRYLRPAIEFHTETLDTRSR